MRPALALLEFSSVAVGIVAGDAMVKRAPVAGIVAGTVHPGGYLVMVTGEVGDVEEAVIGGVAAGSDALVDRVFLPEVHAAVTAALGGGRGAVRGEALGVIETVTVAATLEAADAAMKRAEVSLLAVRLADGLGGKAYALYSGSLPEVQSAIDAGLAAIHPDAVVGSSIVPNLAGEMGENVYDAPRFGDRAGWGSGDAAG